jgi:Amt family ammonium transporter
MKNMMDLSFGVMGYFFVGFALMFGAGNAFMGQEWFALIGAPEVYGDSIATYAFFFFQAAFAATAATIVAGAIAERTKFYGYLVISILITAFIYPVVGHWTWGGGFLFEAGFQDFAGSTVVHSVGGWIALTAAIIIGPRIGRFDPSRKQEFTGHSIPLATLGVLILWFGWYGFNPGSQLAADGANASAVALIALNTTLAAAAGGITTMLSSTLMSGKPSAGLTLNGTLGGLVGITAGCDAVAPISAIIIGFFGGLAVYYATYLLEKLEIDDAVGAFPVHGAAGIVGTLCVGLFALDGGLLTGGGTTLLGSQIQGIIIVGLWTVLTSGAVLLVLKHTIGIRAEKEHEIAGLDESKHGISAYPDFEKKA